MLPSFTPHPASQGDASLCLLLQFAEQGDAGLGSRLLAGGEDAVATQGDDIFQRLVWVAAYVEGAVEGDGHALCSLHQLFHQGEVYVAFGR